MVIGLMRKKEKKFHPQDSNLGPLELGPYNCTTMHMVSGHHGKTFSSISHNQRGQSKYEVIYFSHSIHAHIKNFH